MASGKNDGPSTRLALNDNKPNYNGLIKVTINTYVGIWLVVFDQYLSPGLARSRCRGKIARNTVLMITCLIVIVYLNIKAI